MLRVQRESRVVATCDQADSSVRHTLLVPIPFTFHTIKEKAAEVNTHITATATPAFWVVLAEMDGEDEVWSTELN